MSVQHGHGHLFVDQQASEIHRLRHNHHRCPTQPNMYSLERQIPPQMSRSSVSLARVLWIAKWLLVFPSLFLTTTLFALNFIGDGLRDALDPKDR